MPEICNRCGLPKELCICDTIAKEQQKIKISVERKRYGKKLTIVDGITSDMNPQKIAKKLKEKFACGGTFKHGKIELQGYHKDNVKQFLIDQGFSDDNIEVK